MMNFRKSSFCTSATNCIEIAENEELVLMREPQQPNEIVEFSRKEWEDFILGIKNDEF